MPQRAGVHAVSRTTCHRWNRSNCCPSREADVPLNGLCCVRVYVCSVGFGRGVYRITVCNVSVLVFHGKHGSSSSSCWVENLLLYQEPEPANRWCSGQLTSSIFPCSGNFIGSLRSHNWKILILSDFKMTTACCWHHSCLLPRWQLALNNACIPKGAKRHNFLSPSRSVGQEQCQQLRILSSSRTGKCTFRVKVEPQFWATSFC